MEDLLSAGGLIRNRVDGLEGVRLRSDRRWQRMRKWLEDADVSGALMYLAPMFHMIYHI
jgi:hypothetical protein